MKEQNHPFDKLRAGKKASSKKIIPILAAALIIVGIILIVVLSNSNKVEKTQSVYNPGNVEVIVTDNAGGTQNSAPTTAGDNMVNNLGAATTGEINGGASNVQEGVGNTEKLLEGKEIEVNK